MSRGKNTASENILSGGGKRCKGQERVAKTPGITTNSRITEVRWELKKIEKPKEETSYISKWEESLSK